MDFFIVFLLKRHTTSYGICLLVYANEFRITQLAPRLVLENY